MNPQIKKLRIVTNGKEFKIQAAIDHRVRKIETPIQIKMQLTGLHRLFLPDTIPSSITKLNNEQYEWFDINIGTGKLYDYGFCEYNCYDSAEDRQKTCDLFTRSPYNGYGFLSRSQALKWIGDKWGTEGLEMVQSAPAPEWKVC